MVKGCGFFNLREVGLRIFESYRGPAIVVVHFFSEAPFERIAPCGHCLDFLGGERCHVRVYGMVIQLLGSTQGCERKTG